MKNNFKYINYMDQKGGYISSALLVLTIIFILVSSTHVFSNVNKYKYNWDKYKCKPGVIPIAGFIKKEPDMSPVEFTKKNMQDCFSEAQKELVDEASAEYKKGMEFTKNKYNSLEDSINFIGSKIKQSFELAQQGLSYLVNSIINVIVSIMREFITVNSFVKKNTALITLLINFIVSTVYSIKSFFGSFLDIVITFLKIFGATIVTLWLIPFGQGAALAATTLFLAAFVPLSLVAVGLKDLKIKHKKMPKKVKKKRCFYGNTIINSRKFSELEIGDEIGENNIVTGLFLCSAENLDMYSLQNIIVSGSHRILYKNEWISISDHPDACKTTYSDPFVYCINTSKKYFDIDGNRFLDWDEIDHKLDKMVSSVDSFKKYFTAGVCFDTPIKMKNLSYKTISDVNVGDVLYGNNKVLAIVYLEPLSIYHYTDNMNNNLCRGSNIELDNTHNKKLNYNEYCFHLVTENGTFYINEFCCNDYDFTLDKYNN
jgi:hypothetical protein